MLVLLTKRKGSIMPDSTQKDQNSKKLMVASEYDTLARQIPNEWGSTPKEKKALVASIHKAILGKDKQVSMRPLNDLVHFMFVCTQRQLNPFKGQIHAVYIWDSELQAEKLVPITGIGGFRS